ncbi:hypothetical protein IEO21_09969 [Rhodonia placenta]|uniref:Uncharacterized protein n=1 Tax=Rhodonia placenta TaxID=104341 RepID=A0A8H7NTH5_9APHY|nr:hypothetical protein IEO21_09969 [Postia placenta]
MTPWPGAVADAGTVAALATGAVSLIAGGGLYAILRRYSSSKRLDHIRTTLADMTVFINGIDEDERRLVEERLGRPGFIENTKTTIQNVGMFVPQLSLMLQDAGKYAQYGPARPESWNPLKSQICAHMEEISELRQDLMNTTEAVRKEAREAVAEHSTDNHFPSNWRKSTPAPQCNSQTNSVSPTLSYHALPEGEVSNGVVNPEVPTSLPATATVGLARSPWQNLPKTAILRVRRIGAEHTVPPLSSPTTARVDS